VTTPLPTATGRFRGLSYSQFGTGRPVIALHGFGETAFSWRHLIGAIPNNVALYVFDLRGCGKSDKPHDDHYGLRDQADLISAFAKEQDFQDLSLIGHSMGGGVALLTAMNLPADRLHSIVLIDSIAFPQRLPWFMRLLRTPVLGQLVIGATPPTAMVRIVMSWAFHDSRKIEDEAVSAYAQNFSTPNGRYAQLQIANSIIPPDLDAIITRYPLIEAPSLIIWGAEDRIVPRANGINLKEALPHSRLLIVPDCGHIPQEEQPHVTIPAITAFLSDPAPTGRGGDGGSHLHTAPIARYD